MMIDEKPESESIPHLLRVEFSDAVDPETLQTLHSVGLTATVRQDIRDLIDAVEGEQLTSVYQMSPEEIDDDEYGFASEFKLYLRTDSDPDTAIESLKRSPLVKSVRTEVLRRSSED